VSAAHRICNTPPRDHRRAPGTYRSGRRNLRGRREWIKPRLGSWASTGALGARRRANARLRRLLGCAGSRPRRRTPSASRDDRRDAPRGESAISPSVSPGPGRLVVDSSPP
jgi:hypothetical protein